MDGPLVTIPHVFFFTKSVTDLENELSGSGISRFKGEEIAGAFLAGLLAITAEKLGGSNTPVDFTEKWGDASISDDSAEILKDTFLAVQKRSEVLRSNWKGSSLSLPNVSTKATRRTDPPRLKSTVL